MSYSDDYNKLRKKRKENAHDLVKENNRVQYPQPNRYDFSAYNSIASKDSVYNLDDENLSVIPRGIYPQQSSASLDFSLVPKGWTPEETEEETEEESNGFWNFLTSLMPSGTAASTFAPKKSSADDEDDDRTWFDRGAFEDGYDTGDVVKSILGTISNTASNLYEGALKLPEQVVDTGAYLVGGAGKIFGNDVLADNMQEFIEKDLIDEKKIADVIVGVNGGYAADFVSDKVFGWGKVTDEENSMLGEKSQGVAQSVGQWATQVALTSVGVPWWLTSGVQGFGSGVEEAFGEGASFEQAGMSAGMKAGAEILTEKLFGGSGLGEKGLINLDALTKGISNKSVKALFDFGLDVNGEGTEEAVSAFFGRLAEKLTYEKEDTWKTLLTDGDAMYDYAKDVAQDLFSDEAWEEYRESFIGGTFIGGIANAGKTKSSIKNKTDYRTGLTETDQKVFDKLYKDAVSAKENESGGKLTSKEKAEIYDSVMEQMEKGGISLDTIEEVLGGDDYKVYKESFDRDTARQKEYDDWKKEYDVLYNTKGGDKSDAQIDRQKLLKQQIDSFSLDSNTDSLKDSLSKKVYESAKYGKLAESYREVARKGQAFQADLSQFKGKQKEAIERAIKSGVLNNTNRSHELVRVLSMIEADKGIIFDYTNNAKLKESGFAIDGKTVNGFEKGGTVTLNVQSAKSWQSVVGHEITHVLEGTDAYKSLQKALYAYAEGKGELASRKANLTEIYKDIKDANIDAELTADLVGDYLFSDSEFIKHLTTDRNVFQRVYDEIKYLCKVATGKEKVDIEKVKHEFDKVWEELSAKNVSEKTDGKVNLSVSETTDGRIVAVVDNDILEKIDTTSWNKEKKETAKEAAVNALRQFSGGIVVDGITRKVNRTSRREYTRSGDTEELYNNSPDIFADKMRAAEVADDIIVATTNWNRDGGLEHPRKDNFVDFDHGTALIMSGNAKYIADVVVGITKKGEAVFYDVVDMTPTTFEIKKAETSTTATTQNAIGDINEISAEDIVTENGKDVKRNFSLSNTVEETKNLVALHNLTESKLNKVMVLGGFPMPSIAVTRTDIPHTNFGDITLVMNKSTIDPKANRKNTVYSADAWTPTVPRTEYKPNDSRLREISNKVYGLVGDRNILNKLDYVAFDTDNVSRDLDNTDGNLADKYRNNKTLKYAFLKDIGANIELPMTEENLYPHGVVSNKAIRYFAGKLTNGLQTIEHYRNMRVDELLADKELINAITDTLNWGVLQKFEKGSKVYETIKQNPRFTNETITFAYIDNFLNASQKLLTNGVKQTVDGRAASNAIQDYMTENNLQEKYELWLNDLFDGVVEKTGIYNNKDIFTPSGNRRTFEQLHLPVTLENIVKAMASQNNGNTKNVAGFNGVKTLRAGMAERFKSIDDMHKLESRLQNLTAEEFDAIHDDLSDRMHNIINRIIETAPESNGNIYMRMDSVGETLMEIAESGNYSTDAIINTVNQYIYNIDENIAEEIRTLLYDVSLMPTNMFEAKPERAVGFDEVNAAILPDGVDNALRERLESMGVKVLTYEKGNDTDRLNKLNSLLEKQPDWKFSLSNEADDIAPVGTPLKDLYFDAPVREDIPTKATPTVEAPIKEDAKNTVVAETTTPNPALYNKQDGKNGWYKDYRGLTEASPSRGALYDALKYVNPELLAEIYYETDMAIERSIANQPLDDLVSFMEDKVRGDEYTPMQAAEMLSDWYESHGLKEKYEEWLTKHNIPRQREMVATPTQDVAEEVEAPMPDANAPITDAPMPIDAKTPTKITDNFDGTQSISEYIKSHPQYADFNGTTVEEFKAYKEWIDTIAEDSRNLNGDTAYLPNDIAPMPTKATTTTAKIADGTRGDELLYESLDNYPMKTTEQKVAEKIRAVEGQIADNKAIRNEAIANYDTQIANLQKQYANKKNKNTKAANNLLASISRLERLKASLDADYSKRISDLEARAEKMKDPKYSVAMQKQAKMQEHAKWAEDLLGDTSTWVDKKLGLQYSTNTERRNLRDIVRDANGNADIARADAIDDALNGRYNREEAAKKRELAQVRKKYADLKITNAETAYIQMLGELRHNPDTTLTQEAVNEYYEKHKDKINTAKVDKVIELARQDYDNFIKRVNEKLREQGMKEIPYRQGYFLHYTDPKQNFVQKLLNWKTQDNEIPTSIAGLTEDFKPVKSWQAFDKQRHSDKTDYNFLKGFDTYSQGVLDWIYHLDTLQKRRAVENHIRFTHSDEGIKKRIKEVYANEELDANEAQAQIEHILAEAKNPLNNFVQDFTTKTNILAGKKNSLDRAVEQSTNRHIYSVMTNVQNRMSANMVLANVRSAMTNFIPITQSWTQVSPLRSLQATKDVISNAIKDDGLVEKSTFLTNRLKEPDNLYNTTWDKVLDKAGIMFEVVDNFSSQVIWRSKYSQNIANGMSESEAIKNADQFAENVMAGRSKGNEPTLFNAKNPLTKAFTMFQLEVNNQYGYLFKDAPNDLKAETKHWKLNLAKGYTTAFIGAYVYNEILSSLTGSGAALDPIGIIKDLLRDLGLFDEEEEKEPTKVLTNFVENVGGELPFVGGPLFGGGRIPISSAIPYGDNGLVEGIGDFAEDVTEGNWGNIGKEMMNPILNVGLPVGGGQIKKTYQGLNMFSDEHPVSGSYTDSGNLRFPVEDTLGNRIQAGLFGQYASKNAREYFDNDYAPLKEKQIKEYIDVDMPISDYWKYRKGLSGLKTNAEKADYIDGLNISNRQKNILMNNILDRKEDVDMSNYDEFEDFEEFDYATKNPEKYAFSKSVGGYSAYKTYSSALNDIKADKDANGKTIKDSRKEKVIDYINGLDADYETKIILYKSEYTSDDTYNNEIIEYLNNREDLTYEERVTIFTELGFTVKDGYVYWD